MKSPQNVFLILFICLSTFCKHTNETISLNDLNKCKTVVSKNKNVEVKSFVVAVFIKVKADTLSTIVDDGATGLYREFKITGNVLSKEVLDFFKQKQEEKQYLKIEITDVIAVENGNEGNYDGFVFYLH